MFVIFVTILIMLMGKDNVQNVLLTNVKPVYIRNIKDLNTSHALSVKVITKELSLTPI